MVPGPLKTRPGDIASLLELRSRAVRSRTGLGATVSTEGRL